MSTATICQYEYRCTRCFHALYASTEEAGSEKPCSYCGTSLVLPEATEDRIARAQQAPAQATQASASLPFSFEEKQLSDAELMREVQRQVYVPPGQMQHMNGVSSSCFKRFFGLLIDGALMGIMFVAGFLLTMALVSAGLIPESALSAKELNWDSLNAMAAMYFPAIALALFQWNLIATHGQSIAKKLLGMRIVTGSGHVPGFIQGVVLRNWVRAGLNMLPFFGLIDALFIFGDARRCVHDYIAGTYVIDVY